MTNSKLKNGKLIEQNILIRKLMDVIWLVCFMEFFNLSNYAEIFRFNWLKIWNLVYRLFLLRVYLWIATRMGAQFNRKVQIPLIMYAVVSVNSFFLKIFNLLSKNLGLFKNVIYWVKNTFEPSITITEPTIFVFLHF